MLKKLMLVAIASGIAATSFAQAPAAPTTSTPPAAEKKAETAKPAKHVKKHHKTGTKKTPAKAESATSDSK